MKPLYFTILPIASGLWIGMTLFGGAPDFTALFRIYPTMLLVTEFYLVFFKQAFPKPYSLVKFSQRGVELLIIYLLINGDFGRIIMIELLLIAGELLLKSRFNSENPSGCDFTWERINRVDFEMARFLLVTLAVLGFTYRFDVMGEARFLLLAGLYYRKAMTVHRQSRKLKPGCNMDRIRRKINFHTGVDVAHYQEERNGKKITHYLQYYKEKFLNARTVALKHGRLGWRKVRSDKLRVVAKKALISLKKLGLPNMIRLKHEVNKDAVTAYLKDHPEMLIKMDGITRPEEKEECWFEVSRRLVSNDEYFKS